MKAFPTSLEFSSQIGNDKSDYQLSWLSSSKADNSSLTTSFGSNDRVKSYGVYNRSKGLTQGDCLSRLLLFIILKDNISWLGTGTTGGNQMQHPVS